MVQKRSKTAEKPRRGRPRQYDPDRALAGAADAFWQSGYAGTSLDELSAATGMNRPSLYAAFGDKSDLYLKTLERYRDQSRALALELLAMPVHNEAEIEGAIGALARKQGAGLISAGDPFTVAHRALIIHLSEQHRMPAIYQF